MRVDILRARIRETGLPMVYVNMVGAQDELVFDGGSFVLDGNGKMVAKMAQFEEGHRDRRIRRRARRARSDRAASSRWRRRSMRRS